MNSSLWFNVNLCKSKEKQKNTAHKNKAAWKQKPVSHSFTFDEKFRELWKMWYQFKSETWKLAFKMEHFETHFECEMRKHVFFFLHFGCMTESRYIYREHFSSSFCTDNENAVDIARNTEKKNIKRKKNRICSVVEMMLCIATAFDNVDDNFQSIIESNKHTHHLPNAPFGSHSHISRWCSSAKLFIIELISFNKRNKQHTTTWHTYSRCSNRFLWWWNLVCYLCRDNKHTFLRGSNWID